MEGLILSLREGFQITFQDDFTSKFRRLDYYFDKESKMCCSSNVCYLLIKGQRIPKDRQLAIEQNISNINKYPERFVWLPKNTLVQEIELIDRFVLEKNCPQLGSSNFHDDIEKFKQLLYASGLRDDWLHFRDDAYMNLVRNWAHENDVKLDFESIFY